MFLLSEAEPSHFSKSYNKGDWNYTRSDSVRGLYCVLNVCAWENKSKLKISNKLKYVFVFGKSGKRHVCILDKIFRSVWLVQGLKLTRLRELGFCIKLPLSQSFLWGSVFFFFLFFFFNPFKVLEAQFLCVLGIWAILDLCKLLLVPINQSEQISFNLKVFII